MIRDFFLAALSLSLAPCYLVRAAKSQRLSAAPSASSSKLRYVTIGTGGITGVYYPTGGAISHGEQKDTYKLRCTVDPLVAPWLT